MFFGGTLAFFMVQAFPFLFILNLSFFGVFWVSFFQGREVENCVLIV
jgi:hypothetical protein